MARRGHLELVTSDSMQREVDAAKLVKQKRRAKAAVRPVKTYEVKFIIETDPTCPWHFRLRCPELTLQQLRSDGKLVGEVSWMQATNKWTPFTRGMIDMPSSTTLRFIREVGEGE